MPEGTEVTELAEDVNELVEAELVDDTEHLPAQTSPDGPVYRITRNTMLGPGEEPPRVEEHPGFRKIDFHVSERTRQRLRNVEGGGRNRNTKINRDSTRERFRAWCETAENEEPENETTRVAWPSTTAANVAEYIGTLMETGQPDGTPYSPDTLLAYVSRILTWYPKGERPDGSAIRDMIEDYRELEYKGLKDQAAALTLEHLLPTLDKINESTRIGRRDAALLVLGYRLLLRGIEVADLPNHDLRPVTSGPRRGVWVRVAKTKTTSAKDAVWRFYADRPDLRFTDRVVAWQADLTELGANAGHLPFLRALTKKGNLQKGRDHATVRGLRLSGRTVNTVVKTRAGAAGRGIIDGLPVRSHSLRVGANNDLKRAKVSRAARNEEGRWSPNSVLTDTTYTRADALAAAQENDVFEAVPLYGQWPTEANPDGATA
ncbi:hypothetical protein ACIQCG_01030 [Streptomyces noursei]|uniref:hypothetical protein n=1 Tax=Streptomyces noursei TaxID=1971 RepID=UPI0023B79E76|nr:hypothetical protein [Streptomyces noursei]